MDDKKNLLIAVLLCVVAWLSVELWIKPAPITISTPASRTSQPIAVVANKNESIPLVIMSRKDALQATNRVSIVTPNVKGSISLKGGLVDDWRLTQYHETTANDSPEINVLSPWLTKQAYYGAFRWYISPAAVALEIPDDETIWEADAAELTDERPVTLTWKNNKGIVFQQIFSIDEKYMLSVKQVVSNLTQDPITVGTKGLIRRYGPVETAGYFMLHEGPLGVFSGKLKEFSYKDLSKSYINELGQNQRGVGWLGITDKYWLAAIIPNSASQGQVSSVSSPLFYETESLSGLNTVGANQSHSQESHFFVGPKQLSLLDKYETSLKIDHFDLAVDFGWFYFLTKPMFYLLSWLKNWAGSFGIAIILMTVVIKAAFFPLSLRMYRSMAKLKKLQPNLLALKNRFADDKVRLNQETMAFYRKEKVNPVSGCLPMLIQIPVFFSLYKVLFISIEMRQAPFWGWIHDLASPDPTTIFNCFGLFNWALPDLLQVGAWPIMMGLSMILQQRLNTSVSLDFHQKIMFTYVMPVVFTFMLAQFPVGLVIYWTWSNVLTVCQQWVMMRYYQEA